MPERTRRSPIVVLASLTLAWLSGGCDAPPAPPTDAGTDVPEPPVDAPAGPLRLDVTTCAGLTVAAATRSDCADAATSGACAALLDVPSFEELATVTSCEAAGVAAGGMAEQPLSPPLTVDSIDCSGMTVRSTTGDVRVHFGSVLGAADLAANSVFGRGLVSARIDGGACVRTLSLETTGGVAIELHEVPATGGIVESTWLSPLHVTPLAEPTGSCASLDRVCLEDASGDGFALSPCGGAELPVGACGTPSATGFVGAASCGGPIHVAIFPTGTHPACP